MSDLISRNALLDAIPKNDELLSVDVRRIICESPKVDAEPVRHGKCDFCGRFLDLEWDFTQLFQNVCLYESSTSDL